MLLFTMFKYEGMCYEKYMQNNDVKKSIEGLGCEKDVGVWMHISA